MKLVYVTGCLGFIGSYVTRKCLERGWKVYGVDKKWRDVKEVCLTCKQRKDDERKSRELLDNWGIDMDTIGKYREGL